MSKKWKIALIVGVVVVALLVGGVAVTGYALAQRPTPPGPWSDDFPGPWMRRPGGGHGWMGRGAAHLPEYREQMQAALAEALGISVEELEAARAEAPTPFEVADQLGVDPAKFHQAIEAARQEAIEQAVEDGVLTPEQGERMSQRFGHGDPWGGGRGGRMGPSEHWFGPDAPDDSE